MKEGGLEAISYPSFFVGRRGTYYVSKTREKHMFYFKKMAYKAYWVVDKLHMLLYTVCSMYLRRCSYGA